MPEKVFYDSHVHLADEKLVPFLEQIAADYQAIGLKRAVVVGTSPNDWEKVIQLCQSDSRYLPAIGLHPWWVNDASSNWKDQFLKGIENGTSIIGEIGLDQWIEDYDLEKQIDAFKFQFQVAAERNLPTSIHCLKAQTPLLQTLRSVTIPRRGFKLHAYSGPLETIPELLEHGAYFSFNAAQIRPNARRMYQIVPSIPKERLLLETDAPDFRLPNAKFRFDSARTDIRALQHPANIAISYESIAQCREVSVQELMDTAALNFERYFGRTGAM